MSCDKYLEEQGMTDLKPRLRCISCGMTVAQIYNEDKHRIQDGEWIEYDGSYTAVDKEKQGWMCGSCLEYEEAEPAAVVVLYSEHEKYKFRIGSYAIIEVGDDEVPGDLFEEVIRPYAQNLKWHSTDAWRGHYASKFGDGWVKVIDDWFGTVDGHNCDRGDLGKFYDKQNQIPDFPMMVCFPRTSNVCACGISVFVPRDFVEIFKKWLGVDSLEVEI